jgi:hypothetical protein
MDRLFAVFRAARWLIAGAALAAIFTARPALAHTALQGYVKDTAGNPMAGVWVYAYDAGNNIAYGLTDDNGFYDLTVLPGAGWSVTALAPGYKVQTTDGFTPIVDTHNHGPDPILESAPPFPLVKAAAPIPLTAGIDSPEFADAPQIEVNKPYHVVIGLDTLNAWKGPQSVSGRFRVKWDEQALYYAGEVTWAKPHLNSQKDGDIWNGNALQFFIQTSPHDRGRTAYNPDENWHLIVGDGPMPSWWLFGAVQARPDAEIGSHFLATDKPSGDGIFFRLNVPWSLLKKSDGQGIAAPGAEALGAIGIGINAADPAGDRDNTSLKLGLSWPMSDTNGEDPSYLQPVVFTAKAL